MQCGVDGNLLFGAFDRKRLSFQELGPVIIGSNDWLFLIFSNDAKSKFKKETLLNNKTHHERAGTETEMPQETG